MDILVGYTGFVGSNLNLNGSFDAVYNSKNIEDAFGTNPDLCIYSGVRAEKFLANKNPDEDLADCVNAAANISKINPKRLVLISTIDVYKNPVNVDEKSEIITDGLHPYGLNRYILEQKAAQIVENHHIIRLPGLFGKNLKKNFIYDLINYVPSMLNEEKYLSLSSKEPIVSQCYISAGNGFYKLSDNPPQLRRAFERAGFSALNFTDSRAVFQFYNLLRLLEDINKAVRSGIRLLNLATEPVSVSDIHTRITGKKFINEITDTPPYYDFKTVNSEVFGGNNGYIASKVEVLDEIADFVHSN